MLIKKHNTSNLNKRGLLGLKLGIINRIKPDKRRLSFSWKKKVIDDDIEILDVDEKEDCTKIKLPKIKNKKRIAIGTIAVLVLSIFTLLIIPGQNIIKTSARKFLDSLGIYTEEVKSVEIQSDDYNNPGSWYIDKSAKWVRLNKAQVIFDVNSVVKTDDSYKDIVLVIDTSSSMSGSKLEKAISDSKELINYVLSDSNNRIAIVTFDSASTIISEFSSNKDNLVTQLDSIVTWSGTNYNAALKNVDIIMQGYVKKSNRNVVTLFLTDGYPNEDTPSQIGTYESLKEKYPYMAINGVQYEMGTDIIDAIKRVTDSQWTADQSTLNNILFEASVSPATYEDFIVTDYIDEKFEINSVDDIKVTMGSVILEEENGLQKVIWNLGKNSYITGSTAKMYINLTLKEQYFETEGFFPTNNKETIESKLLDDEVKTVNSTKTPVLKGMYEVIYDTNTPEGCTLSTISNEKYFVYQNVTKNTNKLICDGYLFKGWEIDDEDSGDIIKVNDDVFKMPGHDVTIRGTWAKQSIKKTMDGTIYEKTTLYKVLKEAAEEGTYAKEYTGNHKDSVAEDTTQKIYYWYGSNDVNGTSILDKNNIIFAGQCWQMIRTTDTGGVKMIYNGEAVNNQCLNTRSTHAGYLARTTQNLNKAYYYGTNYTYDSIAKSFSLTGTVTTGEIKTGQYTCKQNSADARCTTLYYIDSLYYGTTYYVLPLNTKSHYSQFGTLQFNQHYDSPAGVGYMYNTLYTSQNKTITLTEDVLSSTSLSTDYWYADEMEYDPDTRKYLLVNPYKVSSTSDYAILVGKYTLGNTTETYTALSVDYIVAVNDSTVYYVSLTNGFDLSYFNNTYTYGDSYTDNGDGTYTINSPTTIERKDWYASNSTLKNKYVCKKATNNVCSDLWYTTSTSNTSMQYLKVTSLKYAKDFEYKIDLDDGTYKYFLNDDSTVSFWNMADSTNQKSLNNAHYTCFNTTGKCTEISYIFHLDGEHIYYINIKDGKSVGDAKNEMLYNDNINTTNSTIKTGIDAWYENYLLKYSDYLEDTIFCNDRSQSNSGTNGWNPNGGSLSTIMYFYGSNDLSCPNVTDQFSTLNSKAKLKYKVGLMSYREMELLNNFDARKTGQWYWLGSPTFFSYFAREWYVSTSGNIYSNSVVVGTYGVRMAISLKPGTEYVAGDGSMASPYIVETD